MFKRRESKEEIAERIYAICEKSFPGYQEAHPDNILAPPMKPEDFVYEVIRHLLGPNWYVNYSCGVFLYKYKCTQRKETLAVDAGGKT